MSNLWNIMFYNGFITGIIASALMPVKSQLVSELNDRCHQSGETETQYGLAMCERTKAYLTIWY